MPFHDFGGLLRLLVDAMSGEADDPGAKSESDDDEPDDLMRGCQIRRLELSVSARTDSGGFAYNLVLFADGNSDSHPKDGHQQSDGLNTPMKPHLLKNTQQQ